MDSSNAPIISSTANELYFKGPYLRQNWSLPDSIIYYLAKNPKSPKCFQKMIQSCKYFFSKNSVIVCSDLNFYGKENESQIEIEQDKENMYINLKNVSHNLWITNRILINAEKNLMSSLIPNIYQCDVKKTHLHNQIFSFNELLFLASKADEICLSRCSIKNEDGSVVYVEKIIEVFDRAKTFYFEFNENDSSISSKTVENLIKIPHFSSINNIYLNQISDAFDIETFFAYIKKNKHTFLNLIFNDSISGAYRNRLEEIIDEILATKNHDYKPPMINFNGLSIEHRGKLRSIFDKFIFTTF